MYLSCVGTVLMLLVMTDKLAFTMCWKQFLFLPFLLLFGSLRNVISGVHWGFPTGFLWQPRPNVHLKPLRNHLFESSVLL